MNDNVTMFHNPDRDYLNDTAREVFLKLSEDIANLRLSLECLTKSELLLFRSKMGALISPQNLDSWHAFQVMLLIVGGEMALRHDTNPEPGRSTRMPPPDEPA
jgi:hypothetical protein